MAVSEWQRHAKHIIVLTAAGKPIYSRYGDEMDVTAITSIITALVGRTLDTEDPIKSIVAGDTTFVFMLRGPVYLVAVSRTGEPVAALGEQLRAVHSIMLQALTVNVERRLMERPNLDMRSSLAGTPALMTNIIRVSNRMPSVFLDALPVLTLTASTRSRINAALATASARCPGIVYALLVAGYTVAGWAQTRAKELALRPHDALLLANWLQCSAAFRVADTWTPVCMPTMNDGGFLHAYVSCLHPSATATAGATAAGAAAGGSTAGGGGGGGGGGGLVRASSGGGVEGGGGSGVTTMSALKTAFDRRYAAALAFDAAPTVAGGASVVAAAATATSDPAAAMTVAATPTAVDAAGAASASDGRGAAVDDVVVVDDAADEDDEEGVAGGVLLSDDEGEEEEEGAGGDDDAVVGGAPRGSPPPAMLARASAAAAAGSGSGGGFVDSPGRDHGGLAALALGGTGASDALAVAVADAGGTGTGGGTPHDDDDAGSVDEEGVGDLLASVGGGGGGGGAAIAEDEEAGASLVGQRSRTGTATGGATPGDGGGDDDDTTAFVRAQLVGGRRCTLHIGPIDALRHEAEAGAAASAAAAPAASADDCEDCQRAAAAAAAGVATPAVGAASVVVGAVAGSSGGATSPPPSTPAAAGAAAAATASSSSSSASSTLAPLLASSSSSTSSSSSAAASAAPPAPAAAPSPPPPYHIDRDAPAVFLVLLTSDTSPAHVEALGQKKTAIGRTLRDCDALLHVVRSMSVAGAAGVGDFSATAYGIPGLLHFVYLWKPLRQYTMSRFPALCADPIQRKALLRAYQVLHGRLTATTPPLRHAISTYHFEAADGVRHVAGLHTTNAILLAAFDASVATTRVHEYMERLAKAAKRDHDKLLISAPGGL